MRHIHSSRDWRYVPPFGKNTCFSIVVGLFASTVHGRSMGYIRFSNLGAGVLGN